MGCECQVSCQGGQAEMDARMSLSEKARKSRGAWTQGDNDGLKPQSSLGPQGKSPADELT